MIKLTSTAAVVVLAVMMALGPAATSMYLPAFPAMAASLGTGAEQIQLTLSTYMLGLAMAQLAVGPLADRFGRKPVLLVGLSLFTLASLGCAFAGRIDTLLTFRFLQAFGAAAGMVLAQAMVRDSFAPPQAARTLAYMGSITALAPALSPLAGSALLVQFGWPSIFIVLTLAAVAVLAVVAGALPESLPPALRQPLHPLTVLYNYRAAASSATFLAHTLALSFMFAGHYVFMTSAPFVLMELHGVEEAGFGGYFLVVVLAFISGSLAGAKLSHRVGGAALIRTGGTLLILSGGTMCLLVSSGLDSPWSITGAQFLYGVGSGMMMPQLITGALMPFQRMAGTAAALLGFLQMGSAALSSTLVGRLHDGSAWPMAYLLLGCAACTLAIYLALARRRRR